MESSPPILPRASTLPAGFIDYDDGRPPPTAVLAGNISKDKFGEHSEKPNRSPNFPQEVEGKPSRSKISKVILWSQGDGFWNPHGFWKNDQVKKTLSPGIIGPCYGSSDERSGSSSSSSDSFKERDKLKNMRGDPLSFDSDGKSSVNSEFSSDFLQENSWVDDLLQLFSSYDGSKDSCLKANSGKEQFLYNHDTTKEDKLAMNYGDCLTNHNMDGFLRINRVAETFDCELQKMVNTLEDLKKDNEESLKELIRRWIELDCQWSELLYEREILKLYFARANNQKDTLTLLCEALQGRAQCITANKSLPQSIKAIQPESLTSSLCREHQNQTGIGKYKFDLPQVNHIL